MFLLWRGTTAGKRHKSLIVGLLIACILSFLVSLRLSYGGPILSFDGERVVFINVVPRAWQFGVGALLSFCAASISSTALIHLHARSNGSYRAHKGEIIQ